jgi:hypothetical protein
VVAEVGPGTAYPRIRPQCVHTMLILPLQTRLYGVASWVGERRFMIRCVVSGSTLMFRQARLLRSESTTTADTVCAPTRRFRRRCSGHRGQELTKP